MLTVFFFFFQAEDGIRDIGVTGVQTCALPICSRESSPRTAACPASQIRSSPAADPDTRGLMESRCKESRPLSERTNPPAASPALTSLPPTVPQTRSYLPERR